MKVKKLYTDSILPKRENSTDSGMDVFANNIKQIFETEYSVDDVKDFPFILNPLKRVLVGTGISVSIDKGKEIQVRPRSGMALNNGISIVNTPGTVDSGFTGEICIILINHSNKPFFITKNMKIAQIVLCPVILEDIEEVNELDQTTRGSNGFGSTGFWYID